MYNTDYLCWPNVIKTTAYPYFVTSPLPDKALLLDDVKTHLKIDGTAEDAYLNSLIDAVQKSFESYTGRTLITTKYYTFRDDFVCCYELRKSPLQVVDSVEYLKDDVFQTVTSSIYYVTTEDPYSRIIRNDGENWPTDKDNKFQSIKITFDAGYAANAASLKSLYPDIYNALLQHIAKLYENRGDCSDDCAAKVNGVALPTQVKMTYDFYKVANLFGGKWRCL